MLMPMRAFTVSALCLSFNCNPQDHLHAAEAQPPNRQRRTPKYRLAASPALQPLLPLRRQRVAGNRPRHLLLKRA